MKISSSSSIAKKSSVYVKKVSFLMSMGLVISLVFFLLYYIFFIPNWSNEFVVILACIIFFAGFLSLNLKIGFGFSSIYFLYFGLSHLGVVGAILIDDQALLKFRNYGPGAEWINSYLSTYVVALSGIGIGFFSMVALVFKRRINIKNGDILSFGQKGPREIYFVGLILLLGSIFYLLYIILTGQLNLQGTYGNYRESIGELSGYPWMLFALATGLSFICASGNKKQVIQGSLLFLIPGLILIISGNRGEILFPIAGSLGVLLTRGFKLNFKYVLIGVFIFFLVLPAIFQLRGLELGNIDLKEDVNLRVTDPFVEIGHALRPFIATTEWIDAEEELALGGSYFLPINRILGTVPIFEKPKLEGNRYYVKDRTPRQGYSVLAEAYFNFGKIGIILIPFLIALLITYIGDRSQSYWSLAYAGALLAILVNNIRNSFIFVPGQVLILTIIFFATYMLFYIKNKRI